MRRDSAVPITKPRHLFRIEYLLHAINIPQLSLGHVASVKATVAEAGPWQIHMVIFAHQDPPGLVLSRCISKCTSSQLLDTRNLY